MYCLACFGNRNENDFFKVLNKGSQIMTNFKNVFSDVLLACLLPEPKDFIFSSSQSFPAIKN